MKKTEVSVTKEEVIEESTEQSTKINDEEIPIEEEKVREEESEEVNNNEGQEQIIE